MMTDRHPDTGLSVLLCKGMKAWLMYKPHNPPPQPPSTAKGSSSRLQGKDELVALLATMIGGV